MKDAIIVQKDYRFDIKKPLLNIILTIILAVIPFVLFYRPFMHFSSIGDNRFHNDAALLLVKNSEEFFTRIVHFLYHFSTALIYQLLGSTDIYFAGVITQLIASSFLAVSIYVVVRWRFNLNPSQHLLVVTAIVCLMVITPINFLTPDMPYYGYISITIYHNPTTIFLRPFAFLSFLISLMCFYPSKYFFKWNEGIGRLLVIGIFALVIILATFAKPSFTIALLPALALFAGLRYLTRQNINWTLLVGGIIVPASLVILFQLNFLKDSQFGSPIFSPFTLFNLWSETNPGANENLMIKYILSIAFPLTVYLTHLKTAIHSIAFSLSALIMGIASFYAYFVVYENFSIYGDFIWGAYVSNFIFCVTAFLFLLRIYLNLPFKKGPGSRLLLCVFVFSLHVFSGLSGPYHYY